MVQSALYLQIQEPTPPHWPRPLKRPTVLSNFIDSGVVGVACRLKAGCDMYRPDADGDAALCQYSEGYYFLELQRRQCADVYDKMQILPCALRALRALRSGCTGAGGESGP